MREITDVMEIDSFEPDAQRKNIPGPQVSKHKIKDKLKNYLTKKEINDLIDDKRKGKNIDKYKDKINK